jgi:hypothetical protein
MKSKYFILTLLAGLFLTSCHFTYRNKPEELAIPIVRALQDNDAKNAFCLIPSKDVIDEVVNNNPSVMGNPYYNKYSTDYRLATLKGKLVSDFDIAHTVSSKAGLDWDKVLIGNVTTDEVNQEGGTYTKVTVNLRFPSGGDYIVQYNALKSQSRGWFLGNDVYFGKPLAAEKK